MSDKGYDPQLDHYNPKWLRIPEKVEHYPVGTCMLFSLDKRYIGWGAVAGFWDSYRQRWVLADETYSETKREYHPTHYAPTPHSVTAQ